MIGVINARDNLLHIVFFWQVSLHPEGDFTTAWLGPSYPELEVITVMLRYPVAAALRTILHLISHVYFVEVGLEAPRSPLHFVY